MSVHNQPNIEFQFKGDLENEQSRAVADELSALLQDDFSDWPMNLQKVAPPPSGHREIDPVAMWALVLAIPSAILAGWDLARRLEQKARVERIIIWAQGRAARGLEVPVLLLPDGRAMSLDQATAPDFLNALEMAANRPRM